MEARKCYSHFEVQRPARSSRTLQTSILLGFLVQSAIKYRYTNISIDGHPIPWSTEVKYLGVTLDMRLTFASHIANLNLNRIKIYTNIVLKFKGCTFLIVKISKRITCLTLSWIEYPCTCTRTALLKVLI
jgi:hypothetical protein